MRTTRIELDADAGHLAIERKAGQITKNDIFSRIAREHLGIETLEERNSDSLDFHDVGVVGVRRALEAAYAAGLAAAAKQRSALPKP